MVKKYVTKRTKRDPNRVLVGIKHGRSGYQRGCGCDVCVGAERDYQQERKAQGLQPRNGQSFRATPEQKDNVVKLHSVNGGKTDETTDDIDWPGKPKDAGHLGRTPRVAGAVEKATAEECEALSIAQERPGMVEQAKQLARIMDNPKQIGLWPTTSRQLTSILNDLRGNSRKKSKGRLAKVQAMTKATGTQ